MRIAQLQIKGFRGIKNGVFSFPDHSVIVGPNESGKTSIIEAISLVLGRQRLVRSLTEHDFWGSAPGPEDLIGITLTLTGFPEDDPSRSPEWFRLGRGVPKWITTDGLVTDSRSPSSRLCVQLAFGARFNHSELLVETTRYFLDDDAIENPFDEDLVIHQVPQSLLNSLGFFVLPARRTWDSVASFNSDLFRKTVTHSGGIPATEILNLRDQLRTPTSPLECTSALRPLAEGINRQLERLISPAPNFRLRLTPGDSEGVLQALVPHFGAGEGYSLPASRHGSGLIALQSFLLLLEIGRARRERGHGFLLAMEEPELHVSPGIQARLVAEAISIADQSLCTTHSTEIATLFSPLSIYVLRTEPNGIATCNPLLESALPIDAPNHQRKLYNQNLPQVTEALMAPWILIPEGKLDYTWLRGLSRISEPNGSNNPPFQTVFGVMPTEEAKVQYTYQVLRRLRPGLIPFVDGDMDGDRYIAGLLSIQPPPPVLVQLAVGLTVENLIGWVMEGHASESIRRVNEELQRDFTFVSELVSELKQPVPSGQSGLKSNLLAHEAILGALHELAPCRDRASRLLEALVCLALNKANPLLTEDTTKSTLSTRVMRLTPQ